MDATVAVNNCLGYIHQDFYPTPTLSALFEGPMDRGKDVTEGGAVINSSGAAIISIADVAACLTAIQKLISRRDPSPSPSFSRPWSTTSRIARIFGPD